MRWTMRSPCSGRSLLQVDLAFPHYLILDVYGFVAVIFGIIAWIGIARDGKYPRNAYDFIMGYLRWYARTYCLRARPSRRVSAVRR